MAIRSYAEPTESAAYYDAIRWQRGKETKLTSQFEGEHDRHERAQDGPHPAEDPPSVQAAFNAVYRSIAHSPTLERIQQEAYGDEYPNEIEPFGLVTWSDLHRIARELNVGVGQHFVDLGCGEGGAGLWVARETGASVTGIDISSVAVGRARARIKDFGLAGRARFDVSDITATCLPPMSYDGAITIDVLWMVPEKTAALREAARILRPGARLLMTTWEFPAGRPDDTFVADYRPALSAAGFYVEAYDPIEGWEEQFRALLASYEAAHDDLVREVGDEMAETLIEHQRQRAALLPEWKRVFIRAKRV